MSYFSKKYPFVFIASITTIIAGILHAVPVANAHVNIPPEYWFFVLVGVLQIIWGVNYFYKRTPNMYFVGAVLNLGLTFFWLAVRLMPAPFSDIPETILMIGVVTAVIQLIAFLASFWSLYRFHQTSLLSVFLLVILSIILAGLGYVTAKSSESTLLKIWPEIGEVPHGHSYDEPDLHEDEDPNHTDDEEPHD